MSEQGSQPNVTPAPQQPAADPNSLVSQIRPLGQPGQQRRRRRGGRGRGQGGDRQHVQPQQVPQADAAPDFEDAPEPAPQDMPPVHHDKIELPEAFAKLGLEPSILYALAEIHFKTPSEIQEKLIPVALEGRDVLGQARTGTGKTAAFGLPILQKIDPTQAFQALVLVPTRELAVQVEAEIARFAKHKPIRTLVVYGGQKIHGQIKMLGRNPHVIVGTPGRIMDLQERGMLPLDRNRFIVCDEVDRMFDIGFRDDIRKILSMCTAPHQTIFVSATINDDIERMVSKHMHDPVRVFTAKKDEQLTLPEAKQYYVGVNPWDKQRAIKMLIRQEKPTLAIIFCRTKRSVDKVAAGLEHDGIAASPIHGDLMQNKRERVMRGFRTGKIHVLVATDLASRGIDVHEVSHVINYDIPEDPEVYVHRVGRTARMGATGRAFTFVSHGQGQLQTNIENLINHLMEEYRIDGFVPSPEPSMRKGGHASHHTPPGSQPSYDDNQAPAPAPGTTPVPAPQEADPNEGFMPDGFGHVKLDAPTRPVTGRYYTKRRR